MIARKHSRHAVKFPIEFTGDYDGEGLLTNLSLSGCRLERADMLIEQDDILTLSLYPSLQESPVTIEAAVVRWISGLACGLEFFEVSPEAQHRLERYIAGPALAQT
jgi:hypothetical protein